MKRSTYLKASFGIALSLLVFTSCDDTLDGPQAIADFTYEADPNDDMTIHFTNTSQHHHSSYWLFGDGSDHSSEDSPTHTFPAGGIYEVKLAVMGNGTGNEIVREVSVIDRSLLGERIQDGNFENPENWNVYAGGSVEVTQHAFENGQLILSNGEEVESNVVVWQAIEVQANTDYVFSAQISGGGMHQSWVEFLFGDDEPEEDDDYSDNNQFSMNTWAECGIDPFEGNIVEIHCAGDGETDGIVNFEEGGTKYFAIKAGSWEGTLGPNGVTISNVSLIPADEL
ncbi:PKD domain-containing protein [Anditalea andensis]|uniref:PKD domain-containing protein n=1 Tax=Anditalea andensis TaxID=1048983 RepID=A0A074LKD9_9BACT|nr:PKD domain-containing protein [Anditalea andensis]KEO74292.1 hypothetical protein EL17_09165 [Anditalea andensis]